MRPLPQQEIEDLLYSLKRIIGVDSLNMSEFLPMTISNLKEMSNSQCLHIGMHTHTHPVLSVQSAAIQKRELVENKNIRSISPLLGGTPLILDFIALEMYRRRN